MRVFLGFAVIISVLVSSNGDQSYDTFPTLYKNNIERLVPTSATLFGTDTKIYYIRNGRNGFEYTIGRRSIQDIIRDDARFPGDEKSASSNFLLPVDYDGEEEDNSGFEVIHPEILLIIDYGLYKRFNKSEDLIIPYLVSYWNSVDLRFSELVLLMFQLHISGIIIAEDFEVLTYLQSNKHLKKNTECTVSSIDALIDKGQWLYNMTQDIISLCDYDIAITMTSNVLCNEPKNGECITPTHGVTHPSKVCSDDLTTQKTEKIAIIQNAGAYDRINFAAREIGLLLGSETVGDSNCSEDDGSLSSKNYASVNSSSWSRCSERNFRKLSETPGGRCLKRLRTFKGVSLPSYFPGSVMDADEQCRKLGWTKACQIDESICQRLKCTNSKLDNIKTDECIEVDSEAPDGTKCGDDKICILSRCEYL